MKWPFECPYCDKSTYYDSKAFGSLPVMAHMLLMPPIKMSKVGASIDDLPEFGDVSPVAEDDKQ